MVKEGSSWQGTSNKIFCMTHGITGDAKCFRTCSGFEPGACMYLTAFTTESSQLVKLKGRNRERLIMDWWLVQDLNPGVHTYISCSLQPLQSKDRHNHLNLWDPASGLQPGPEDGTWHNTIRQMGYLSWARHQTFDDCTSNQFLNSLCSVYT